MFTIGLPPQSLGRGEVIDREVAGRGPRGYSRFTHAVVAPCAGLGSGYILCITAKKSRTRRWLEDRVVGWLEQLQRRLAGLQRTNQ